MIHLKSITIKPEAKKLNYYPFDIPIIKSFDELQFHKPVTFFVGENGSGKSTLLEAIAAGVGSYTVGSEDIHTDESLAHARRLADKMTLGWSKKTRRGFFLRAEDFFGYAKRMHNMVLELEEQADEFDENLTGYGRLLAKGAVMNQQRAITNKYGRNLDNNSHGEGFLKLFQSRLVPNGVYILDEPEVPLSPQRQLTLLSLIKEMVNQDSQFIIATHSPILMAFTDASILSFDSYPVEEVKYEDLEHVTLTKAFLSNPEAFLRRL